MFGILLAEKIAHWWRSEKVRGPWRILEPGANNAALAIDILQHLRDYHPETYHELQYITLDPLPVPRAHQQEALSAFGNHTDCLDKPDSLKPLPTFVIANEVLDAFPCHLIEYREQGWQEVWIESSADGEQLHETLRPLRHFLPDVLIESRYPEGYRTEFRTEPIAFLHDMQKTMSHGRMLFLDYGFAEPEYYDQQRTKGTCAPITITERQKMLYLPLAMWISLRTSISLAWRIRLETSECSSWDSCRKSSC